MKLGDKVDYKVNESFIRHARIVKIHDSGKCDLAVTLHPDDFPEFPQAECLAGTGFRRGIEQGTGPNTFSVPIDLVAEKVTALEAENAGLKGRATALEAENSGLATKVTGLETEVTNLRTRVSALQTPPAI